MTHAAPLKATVAPFKNPEDMYHIIPDWFPVETATYDVVFFTTPKAHEPAVPWVLIGGQVRCVSAFGEVLEVRPPRVEVSVEVLP